MSLLQNGNLLKFVSDKVKGFEVKRINAVSGIYVVDTNGYIGIKINDYFSQNGSPYPGNYALVAKGPSYKDLGLGQVTFLEETTGSVTIGDKTYRTVVMPDGKTWMAENLDYKAEGITMGIERYSSIARAAYYQNDEVTYGWEGKKYGLLYNNAAAKALTIAGWHLPSVTEWNSLISACGGKNSNTATKLKSTTGWNSGNGTDNLGFTAFPAGQVNYSNGYGFHNVNTKAAFIGNDCYVAIDSNVSIGNGVQYDDHYAIRLVKDS